MDTPDISTVVASLVAGYFIGGIPFGFIVGRLKGVDIREKGSGNIGATNLGRALGRRWGIAVLLLDISKGLLPVLFLTPVLYNALDGRNVNLAMAAMGLGTVLGHVFTPYLFFRGGKGVATTVGVFGALLHQWILLPVLGYVLVRKLSGFVSAGSIVLSFLLPVAAAIAHRDDLAGGWPVIALAVLIGILVLVRHASNIKRLISGAEMCAPTKQGAQSGGPGAPGSTDTKEQRS